MQFFLLKSTALLGEMLSSICNTLKSKTGIINSIFTTAKSDALQKSNKDSLFFTSLEFFPWFKTKTFTAPYSWTKLVYHLPLLLCLVGIEQKLFSRSKQKCDKVITLLESSSDSDQITLVRCFNAGVFQLWASVLPDSKCCLWAGRALPHCWI